MLSFDYKPKKTTKFTPEEDQLLTHIIVDQKNTNWVTIASLMKGRNVKQCRERWRHVLCKKSASSEWTEEEDRLLMQKYKDFGRKWNKIQCFFPQHTVVQVKNRCKHLLGDTKGLNKKEKVKKTPTTQEKPVEIIEKQVLPQTGMEKDKMDNATFDALFNSLTFGDRSSNGSIDWFGSNLDMSCFW